MRKDHAKEYKMIGNRIAYFRRVKELTQRDVADTLDVDESHISKIERAAVGLSIDMLLDIAQAIGVLAYKLLDFRDMEDA